MAERLAPEHGPGSGDVMFTGSQVEWNGP